MVVEVVTESVNQINGLLSCILAEVARKQDWEKNKKKTAITTQTDHNIKVW